TGPAGQGMTMATGAGTFATPAPVGSPTAPPPPAAQGTSKRAWVLGLGLATLASIAIVIVAITMTRSKGSPTDTPVVTPGTGSGSAATIAKVQEPAPPPDAATVVASEPPVDASEGMPIDPTEAARRVGFLGPSTTTTPDAGVRPTRPAPTRAPDEDEDDATPPVMSVREACTRGCAIVISRCGNASASCVTDCVANEALQRCVSQKFSSCNESAICGLRAVCGQTVLRGSGTCEQAATCQFEKCKPDDLACGCACARTMSPRYAQALSAFDACAINCRWDLACLSNNCKRQVEACAPGA
nr:hypothetical protein [Deltaproteobacteria bacterium]